MNSQIDLRGASGAVYRYRLAEDGAPRTAMSGNYVYLSGTAEAPVVLFIGETDNLMLRAAGRWNEAVSTHGATHMFTRLNISGAARSDELQDLVEALHPVMNQETVKR